MTAGRKSSGDDRPRRARAPIRTPTCPICGEEHVSRLFKRPRGLAAETGAGHGRVEAHVKACGLPVIRLHDTRHGACSLLLAGGVPIEIVQMILGHSSLDVTRKVYAPHMRKAAAAELLTKHRRSPNDAPPDDDDGASGPNRSVVDKRR